MTGGNDAGREERRRELRRVREQLQPSRDFAVRLDEALRVEEERETTNQSEPSARPWLELPFLVSAGAAALLTLFVCLHAPENDGFRVEEHALDLDADGGDLLSLDLALHHHGPEQTDIEVRAPRALLVADHEGDSLPPEACHTTHCRYALVRPGNGPRRMHVSVPRPGRYRMEVEHRSQQATVREVFVIHAHR